MISRAELVKQISNTIGKTKVLELSRMLKTQNFALRDLIDLTFDADQKLAFRAAWLMENIFLINPVFYLFELDYLLEQFNNVTYPSCQRHYVKIMMHITSPTAHHLIREKLQDTNLEPIVEKCFDWMIDPKVKVAVKAFSADVLFNLRSRYPWIAEELTNQIVFLMRNGSPAIQSRGKKLLTGLKV